MGNDDDEVGMKARIDEEIAGKIADFLESVFEKLRENDEEWERIMLRMHGNLGRFFEGLARNGYGEL